MMKKLFFDFIPGIALLFLISVIIGITIVTHAFPGNFEEWLSKSQNPRQALIYFSITSSTIVLILTRLGLEISYLKVVQGENFKRYISGLPLWFLFFTLSFSIVQFWRFYPSCQAPEAVSFEILGTSQIYKPLDTINVSPGQPITIIAKQVDENAILSCLSWELTGTAFQTLGQKNGCQVNITFNDRPGTGYITLLATQSFCNQATLFSVKVNITEEP